MSLNFADYWSRTDEMAEDLDAGQAHTSWIWKYKALAAMREYISFCCCYSKPSMKLEYHVLSRLSCRYCCLISNFIKAAES